jgi:Invasin, domain 3/PASTA domain
MLLRLDRRVLAAWGVAVGCVLAFARPAAATTWVAQNPPLSGLEPAAGAAPHESLTKVSCAAVGSCVAVGSYVDNGGARRGLIETLSDGRFTATTAPVAGLNPAAGGNPQVFLFDVRCPVIGWCVADGQYVDGSGHTQLLAETLSNGSWSATTLPLTGLNPTAGSDPGLGLGGMSCPAQGACVLVGAYANGSNLPLTEQLADGTWTARTAPVETLSPAGTTGQLFDVSCSRAGACTAVGNTDGGEGALIETLSGGSWAASSPSLAGLSPKAGGGGSLSNVSCSSSGACTEVGSYEDQGFNTQGLIVTGTSGATAVDLGDLSPAADSNPLFSFEGVACFASCVAMGAYTFPQGRFTGRQGTVTTISGSGVTTTTASLSGLSPAPTSPAGPGLQAASCADASDCVAVGQYGAANGTIRSILETVTGTSSSAAAPSLKGLTPAAASDPDDTLTGVSCPASGACVAVGNYLDSSETDHAMVVTPPTTTVSVSLSPGTITADDQATTTATAKVSSGAGATVSFSSSDGGEKIGPVRDDGGGKYTATITASEKVGTATITATDESDAAKPSGTVALSQEPPKVHVSVTPSSIAADGKSTATATVTLTGVHGEAVAGQDVVVTTAGPASAGAVSGGAGGTYTATISSTHNAGTVTLTGTDLSVDPSESAHATLETKALPAPKKKGCVVPKLRGDSLGDAKRALRRAHCAVGKVTRKAGGKVRKGHVISSRPGKGAHRKRGARIALVLSRGRH